FNAREAKRLFGFIGAGAISGGIAGGYLTRWLVPAFGTVQMILFCIVFLVLDVVLLRFLWLRGGKQKYRERRAQPARLGEEEVAPVKLVLKSQYLRLLTGIVGIGVIVATLADYQFSTIASQAFPDRDRLTGFFGLWLSNLSIVSLAVQVFFTNRILTRWGVGASLFFLPLAILTGAVGILIVPGLWSAILIKVADGGFKQSVNKAGLELLYLPLPSRVKNPAKAFIDVFVDSFAGGLAGVLLIVFTIILGMKVQSISLMILGLIAAWIALLLLVRNEYINAFRLAIEKRSIDLDEQSVNPEDAATREHLVKVLQSGSHRNVLYVLNLIESSRDVRWIPYLTPLTHHWSPDVRAQVLALFPNFPRNDFSDLVRPLVTDPDDDVRVKAIQYLCRQAPDRVAAVQGFLGSEAAVVRASSLLVAAVEYSTNSQFRRNFPMNAAFRAALNDFQQIIKDDEHRQLMKVSAARVVGKAEDPSLYPYLHVLLSDRSQEVLNAAILAAGETQAPEFFSVLIQHLDTAGVRKTARVALAEAGEPALNVLVQHFQDAKERKSIRLRIPGVLAGIATQGSMDALTANLDQKDLFLRFEIIKALSKLRAAHSELKIDGNRITRKILDETSNYHHILAALKAQARIRNPDESVTVVQARRLLGRALDERLEDNLERIFRLLGLKYPSRDIFNAYRGIVSRRDDQRANAVEFLDNILDSDLKRYILPIVESRQVEALMNTGIVERASADLEALTSLLEGDDSWLQVCVMHLLAQRK
ncbi:MAG TPA: HEAT repeat domain-containing protein, partial [Acidobacteriota bacterium]|nr:HEAT repeat domain-containing protein [Acidobacteriota bacterium]